MKIFSLILFGVLNAQNIQRITLPNGIQLFGFKIAEVPTVSVGILVKGGSAKFEPKQDGLEFLSLKTIFEGSKKYPYPEFKQIAESYGITFSVIPTYDYTLIMMKSLSKYADRGLELLSSALLEPELKEQNFKRVQEQLIEEAKSREENAEEYVWELVNKVFFKNHPYSINPEGRSETLAQFTLENVKNYLRNHIQGKEILIGVVGDYRLENIEKFFNSIPKGKYEEISRDEYNLKKDTLLTLILPYIETGYIAGKFIIPSIKEQEYAKSYVALEILNHRMRDTIRTAYGLSYSVWAGASRRIRNYAYFYISTSYPDSAIELTKKIINALKKTPPDSKEISWVINQTNTIFWRQLATTDNLLKELILFEYLTGKAENFYKFVENIKEVKPEDIWEIFKKYSEPMVIGVIRNPARAGFK